MITINTSILGGDNILNKNLSLNCSLILSAFATDAVLYEWELMSLPEDSIAVIEAPNVQITKFGPLDKTGVYQLKVWTDRNQYNQQQRTICLSVPGVSPQPIPPSPGFEAGGGRVRNWSFELPGDRPGEAAHWFTIDDGNILINPNAGITRGRCIPTNFNVTSGRYAMVLGDDLGTALSTIPVGGEFSVEQDVDFTSMTVLELELKVIE